MARFIMSITAIPIGTKSTSLSQYVAKVIKAFKENNVNFELTPMNTIVHSDNLEDIFRAIKIAHDTLKNTGINRIALIINIDARHDKERKPEDKVKSVLEKLGE